MPDNRLALGGRMVRRYLSFKHTFAFDRYAE